MSTRRTLFLELTEQIQSLQRSLIQRSQHSMGPIPFGQKAALSIIALHNPLGCKELANLLHVTPGAVTQHIEALVQAGLVSRETDPLARRNIIVRLTDKGRELIAQFERERLIRMRVLCKDVSNEELETFVRIFQKMNQQAHEIQKG